MTIRRFTTFALISAIVVLIAGIFACDQIQQLLLPATPQMEGLRGEIAIGAVHPITGRLGLDNPPLGQGFELAVTEINNSQLSDVKIKLIVEDGQSTVEGAVAAFNKLIHQDGVSAILGPATSMQAQAVFPIAQQNRVVAISPTSAARGLSAIGDFIFRTALTTDVLIPSGVRITQEKLGYQKVATIYDDIDLFSTDSDAVVKEALAASGVEILTTETFQTGETDFSAQLTRIKESNPDAIFISAAVTETPEIMIQGRQLGIPADVPFLISVTFASSQIESRGRCCRGGRLLLRIGSAPPTHREIKPSSKITEQHTVSNRMSGRLSRMHRSIFSPRRLPMPNPPIQTQFATHWRTSQILILFWANSLLTPSGMRFTTPLY